MIAVIVDAKRPGSSGWNSVRNCRKVRVQGLHGGEVDIILLCSEKGKIQEKVLQDKVISFSGTIKMVKAEVLRVTEKSRVNIDLEN